MRVGKSGQRLPKEDDPGPDLIRSRKLARRLHVHGGVSKMKDIVALGALAVVSFPIVMLGVLLWTGNVRLVFGPEPQDPMARAKLMERPEDIPGAVRQSGPGDSAGGKIRTDSGVLARSQELDRREADLVRMTQRAQMLQQDDERLRDSIRAERRRIEAMGKSGDSLQGVRVGVLACTFEGMKADQAAKILCAMDDALGTAILRKISDDKIRAKLLAATGKIDVQRAARLSRLLASAPAPATAAKSSPAHAEPSEPKRTGSDSSKKPTEKKP